jgi:catechol 2,3-dioxygenase-like lactoylglutathione lyase family enzyme
MVDVTIQYVNICVSKITQSIDFYRDIVGLELQFTDE